MRFVMKRILLVGVLLLCVSIPTTLLAQRVIDSSFAFGGDAAKKYSIYVPSSCVPTLASALVVAFHPLNTARWNAKSWRDTLIAFAEANDVILVAPDGGVDGRVNDQIDTAFTTVLLDSVAKWYLIDRYRVYAMGFSWGGLTTYTYGLANAWRFAGFMPIGAAINGTTEVTPALQAGAKGKPFYLVHGGDDSPESRYTPIRAGLETNGAILNSILMPGVGHTIDFPQRNQILGTAYRWIDSVNIANNPHSGVVESAKFYGARMNLR